MSKRKQEQLKEARHKRSMVVGRKIVRAHPRFFDDGNWAGDHGFAHNWMLVLDDGTKLTFVAEETETSEYGVNMCVYPKAPRPPRKRRPKVTQTSE